MTCCNNVYSPLINRFQSSPQAPIMPINKKLAEKSSDLLSVALETALDKMPEWSSSRFFVVKTGSLSRGYDFTFGSDLDYMVVPVSDADIDYAMELRGHLNNELDLLTKNASVQRDSHMSESPFYCMPPAKMLDKHLVAKDPCAYFKFENIELNITEAVIRSKSSPHSRQLRDMTFVGGNRNAFDEFSRELRPLLFAARNDKAKSEELVQVMRDDLKELVRLMELDLPLERYSLKDHAIRPFNYFAWINSAVAGKEENLSTFPFITTDDVSSSLESFLKFKAFIGLNDDKGDLQSKITRGRVRRFADFLGATPAKVSDELRGSIKASAAFYKTALA